MPRIRATTWRRSSRKRGHNAAVPVGLRSKGCLGAGGRRLRHHVVPVRRRGPGAPSVKAAKPPQYFVDETKLPFDALAGTTTTRLWGVHGGAGYRVEVPQNWNGELVLYA